MHVGYVLLNCDLGAEEYVVDEFNHPSTASSNTLLLLLSQM